MIDMNMRHFLTSEGRLVYSSGRFGEDDSFIINHTFGESPFGMVLCSFGADYGIQMTPDGLGRSWCGELDITSRIGNGKAWYIKDQISGKVWSPFHEPMAAGADEYEVKYSPGQVSVYSLKNKVATTLTISTVPDLACEVWHVKLQNCSAEDRLLSFTTFVEPCLGVPMESDYLEGGKALLLRPHGHTHDDEHSQEAPEDLVLFHSSTLAPVRYQNEKSRFVGIGGSLSEPAQLDDPQEATSDRVIQHPVASLTVEMELPIEGEAEFGFTFGIAGSVEDALGITEAFRKSQAVSDTIRISRGFWKRLTSSLNINSPDQELNALVNTWLPYEAYAQWILERNEAAYLDPYRIADVLRRLYPFSATTPDICRESLVSFANGLSLLGAYSPDNASMVTIPQRELLWLAISTARYVAETGDTSILSHEIPFVDGPPLSLEQHCTRIIRMCVNNWESRDEHTDDHLLEQTVRQWAFIKCDIAEQRDLLEKLQSRPRVSLTEADDSEKLILPSRAKYLQSISRALAESWMTSELSEHFVEGTTTTEDAGVEAAVYWTIVERLLGIVPTSEGLMFTPKLPNEWKECEITRRYRGDLFRIRVVRRPDSTGRSGMSIIVDGEPFLGNMLPHFGDSCEHEVDVIVS